MWADAYHRHGLNYYPKLQSAIPFTPVTGERIIISDNIVKDKSNKRIEIINRIIKKAETINVSSLCILILLIIHLEIKKVKFKFTITKRNSISLEK